MITEVVAGAGLALALLAQLRPMASVRRELIALAQSARGSAVLDLQTKNVPLARFLYVFSLQVMRRLISQGRLQVRMLTQD
ncbi:hypothetical protein TH4_15225 [Thalassospira tepidiphila MCCC 1A03514]|uniref:Uncharacterized protein n=1 Tax=Thalassospira tepidiphila MCCC 1A03514 TaxID=1177930 RepID=A0A853KXH1_9PROT|nr:hypothetical protein TH4_15225 [Thalassospira tepidiphila MCCC 1A03514]